MNAAAHIDKVFTVRLRDLNADTNVVGINIENSLLRELKNAITNGMLLRNFPTDDGNPNDRLLEFMVNIDLSKIDPRLEGVAHFKVYARLSIPTAIITLRTIDRKFEIEVEHNYDDFDQDVDYDQQEYDYGERD